MADGTATVCCIDVEGNLAIGNVKETSIKSLWNGPKLNAYRKIHLAKKLDSIEACKNCNARETYAF